MREQILKGADMQHKEVYVYNFSDITLEMISLAYEMEKEIEVDYFNQVIYITR